MSVDPAEEQFAEHQNEVRTALIVHCRLSAEQIDLVDESMKAMHLNFAEAAVHTGIVTQHELDRTLDFVNLTADQRGSSIVETAIRRRKPTTDLVVRHTDMVKPSTELILAHDSDNPRSERMRALRTELLLLDDMPGRANVIALVSPCPAEGRSLLAAELAIAFSQLRRRVLLIDADLRNPRQHELFISDNTWGLSQVLGLRAAPRLIGVEKIPQLSILTAGPIVPNPLELLSDGRFNRLVDDWRYNFDDIIIDTPPVSRYADALTVATIATRALVLSRAATTPKKDMKDMMRRLSNTQARIMGAVLSNF
jgi:capsular exopolysaccharide synthesis family protein